MTDRPKTCPNGHPIEWIVDINNGVVWSGYCEHDTWHWDGLDLERLSICRHLGILMTDHLIAIRAERTARATIAAHRDELLNRRWDDSLPPGGYVCATCGQPVESEPCPKHSPHARLERAEARFTQLESLFRKHVGYSDTCRCSSCRELRKILAETTP